LAKSDHARPAGEEPVVEPLVGGEHLGRILLLDRAPERLAAERCGPQEHLEDEKVHVEQCDEGGEELRGERHGGTTVSRNVLRRALDGTASPPD
jgi:hypothetical protein